jgi:hypothetical protein
MTETKSKPTKPTRRKDGVAYPENPFWQPTEVKVGNKFISVAGGMHISNDGDQVSHSGIHIVEEKDKEEFIKVYTRNIKNIFDLKPTAQRVLQYLIIELQKTPDADAIYLSWVGAEEYFNETHVKMSRSSFYTAIKALIKNGFLAESTRPNLFWFNPHLFFNGNRMTFIREYRLKEEKNIKENKKQYCGQFLEG